MSEKLTEEYDGVNSVTSKWTPEELDGRTICLTEISGREDVLWQGVIHAELVGDEPGHLVVSVTTEGGEERAEFNVDQEIMDALVQGPGLMVSDFHISLPMLRRKAGEDYTTESQLQPRR